MKGYVVITAIRVAKRSIPLLIVVLALMVVPKAVFALGGCYIFTDVNLTSTGFPYSVVAYTRFNSNHLIRSLPITAGPLNRTIPITLNERAPPRSIYYFSTRLSITYRQSHHSSIQPN